MTGRFPARTRVLHWLTAILIIAGLLVGFAMVNTVGSYAALLRVHTTIGITVLVVVVVRIVNRFTAALPNWPPTVGKLEGKLIHYSELGMYALMLIQPLIGWTMVSASGTPAVVFGSWPLPRIAPFNADVFFVLRQAHSVGAYLLVAAIAAHISMVLLHSVTLGDHMLTRMTFGRNRERVRNDPQ